MGTQISSVFPNGNIRDSETQLQFLRSIDSQNPKNAQPVSSKLLDFNKLTTNFVLFTCGEMDFVHYWQCQTIFVAAFTAPQCSIPERSYHCHTFRGMTFITIHCNKNCYQVMNYYMDHIGLSITRYDFLTKVISEIDSQSGKDLHYINMKISSNEAPQIRRASPSRVKKEETSSSLNPTIKSIKRNPRLNREIENNDSANLPPKSPKVSIQLPPLEESLQFTNPSMLSRDNEVITYDSINISTSFTTDKNFSHLEEEENLDNSNKNRSKYNSKCNNDKQLESDSQNSDDNEMLSEYSEEENEDRDNDRRNIQKRTQTNNKILTHNNETGSIQNKLANQNLSLLNGSEAAKPVATKKKNTLKKKKGTKKPRKLNKGKKKAKKNGTSEPQADQRQKNDQNYAVKENNQSHRESILNSNSAANNIDNPRANEKNNFIKKNNSNKSTETSNINIISPNTRFNEKSNISSKSNNTKFNDISNITKRNINTQFDDSNNSDITKNANNGLKSNNSIKSNNNIINNNSYTSNSKKQPNDSNDDNYYVNNNTNKFSNNKDKRSNKNTSYLNNNKSDDYNDFDNQPKQRFNDLSDDYEYDQEDANNSNNNIVFNDGNDNRRQIPIIKIYGQGKRIPLELRHREHVDKNYPPKEEEDDEKVVKINLKYTNNEDSNKYGGKHTNNKIVKPQLKSNADVNENENSNEADLSDDFNYDGHEEIHFNFEDDISTETTQKVEFDEDENEGQPFGKSNNTNGYNENINNNDKINNNDTENNKINGKPPIPVPRQVQVQYPEISNSKSPKDPIQISDPIEHSKVPEGNNSIDKNGTRNRLQFSFSNPLEICKPEEKNSLFLLSNQNSSQNTQNKAGSIQVSHLIEISKFAKPKPTIQIDHIVDFSMPEESINSNDYIHERTIPQQRQIQNNNFNNLQSQSNSGSEYFKAVDDRKYQPPNGPIVATIFTEQIPQPIKQKRRRHHHRQNQLVEEPNEDEQRKRHRRRRHHHHHHNNNYKSEEYDDEYNGSDSGDNNGNRKSSPHRRHKHHRSLTRRVKKEIIQDYDNYDDYEDELPDRSKKVKGSRKRISTRSSPVFEKVELTDKSTQLTPTRTVATSTSFFDKETKQSQTKESLSNIRREVMVNHNSIKKESKSTNTTFSESEKIVSDKNQYYSQSDNDSRRSNISSNGNSQKNQNLHQKKMHSEKVTSNDENARNEIYREQPSKQNPGSASIQQNEIKNKPMKKYNNEYEDEDYNNYDINYDNDYDNEKAITNNKVQIKTNRNKQPNNTTVDSSGWSAALNTISGIDNDKANPNQNTVTSRFIKNPNAANNSTISRIDESIGGSVVHNFIPNTNQQPQQTVQKTKIFPLPENNDVSFEEEEEIDTSNQPLNDIELKQRLTDVEEDYDNSVLTKTINEDDELVYKKKPSRSQSSTDRSSQSSTAKKLEDQIENIEPIVLKSSEVSQFDIFSDRDENVEKNNYFSSTGKMKPERNKPDNRKLCLKKVDHQTSPDNEQFNEFSGSNGTTSSDIGDLENGKGNILNESSSSSSRKKSKPDHSSGFSSEFENRKKDSDFTSNAFEAFSTDSSQNYPSYKEISEKIQQASLISCSSLKT